MAELVVKNVFKAYGSHKVLNDLCYEFSPGIYGLLGPNGAGKSTMINLLTDGIRPDAGEILYNGREIRSLGRAYREKLGFMPQQQRIYPGFTLERFLWYMAALKGMNRKEAARQIPELLELVNLSGAASQRLGGFSGGMKQRALLAQALLGNPEVIILDEPTAGLDPKERIRFRNLISQVAFDRIILVATHVVSDIEFIAKEILLMSGGIVTESGTSWELCKKIEGRVFQIVTDEAHVSEITDAYRVVNISKDQERIFIRVLADTMPEYSECSAQKPNLEDFYEYIFE